MAYSKTLTLKQQRVFDYIVWFQRERGSTPTRQEINNHFGWESPNAAQAHLVLMEKKGFIKLLSGKVSRNIQVVEVEKR